MAAVTVSTVRVGTSVAVCNVCDRQLGVHPIGRSLEESLTALRAENAHFKLFHPGMNANTSVGYKDHNYWYEMQVEVSWR